MTGKKKSAQASVEAMYRVFTVPEAPESTLSRIDQNISRNLAGFLQEHIVAVERDLSDVEKDFSDYSIPEKPVFVSEQAQFLLDKLVANSVHTASPAFIGHMTSALPYFMLPLSKIMIALNQNLVKTETSKAFTPMERQVLGMIHRLVYQEDGAFYRKWMHDPRYALGAMCSGGTVANLTALWVARNRAFPAEGSFRGLHQEGLFRALKYYGYEGAAIVVSRRGHYSLRKAADVLGLGRESLIPVDTDDENRINTDALRDKCLELQRQKIKVMAICGVSRRGHYSLRKAADVLGLGRESLIPVDTDDENRINTDALRDKCLELQRQKIKVMAICGVAGTTETGNVDPLDAMADIAREFGAHFHVDAAWGGPTLFSRTYKHLLRGIEKADSVTFDAHKQLYVPMGVGLVVFRDPSLASAVEHHAQYIIRKGSRDLGSTTLEGSRPGMSMLIHSGLKILAREGYEILIDQGIDKAKTFAEMIEAEPDFELVTRPELNILTYRYCPENVQEALACADPLQAEKLNTCLNRISNWSRDRN